MASIQIPTGLLKGKNLQVWEPVALADLAESHGRTVEGISFFHGEIRRKTFRGIIFANCSFARSRFEDITFRKCSFTRVDLTRTVFVECSFSECRGL